MKHCADLKELRHELSKVTTGVAGDTLFGAKALLFIAEQLATFQKKEKSPRKPTAYNRYFAKGIRLGKTAQQIGEEWRKRRS